MQKEGLYAKEEWLGSEAPDHCAWLRGGPQGSRERDVPETEVVRIAVWVRPALTLLDPCSQAHWGALWGSWSVPCEPKRGSECFWSSATWK